MSRSRVSRLSSVSTTGIAFDRGRLAVAVRNSTEEAPTGVVDVWIEGDFARRILISECPDIHDVKIANDRIIVVSSVENAIICLDLASGREIGRRIFDGAPDSWHINDLIYLAGEWCVSGFGNPSIRNWRDNPVGCGLIQSIKRDRHLVGFTNPHSPKVRNGKIYICNSGKNEVLCCDLEGNVELQQTLGNFTRGLYLGRRKLFVGESSHRVRGGASCVTLLDLKSFEVIETIEIEAAEIYAIERVPRWAIQAVRDIQPSPY